MTSTAAQQGISIFLLIACAYAWAGNDRPSKFFTNMGGVAYTRHNLTQSTMVAGAPIWMAGSRNDYGEVCVYCHTPHGSNSTIQAPLWNRENRAKTFATYNQLGTDSLTQPVTQPGANSLTCLSCHDGQTAIDSIINMPGSGGYNPLQATGQSQAQRNLFLDTWAPGGDGFGAPTGHGAMDSDTSEGGCLMCHVPNTFSNATDFRVFVIGTDLTNDHPIGVTFPFGTSDFNDPAGDHNGTRFYDLDGDGRPDSNEIRLYDTGNGAEVECATCHDPHGVPSAGAGSNHVPSFLRVSNSGSGVCLTCHSK